MKSHLLLLPVIGLVLLISENVECVRFSVDDSFALNEIARDPCYRACGTGIMLNNRSSVEHCSKYCQKPMYLHLNTMCLVCKLESQYNRRCEYSRHCKDSPGIFQLTSPSATVAENLTSTTEETEAENDQARNLLEPKAGKSIFRFTVFLSILLLLAIVSICHLVLLIYAISQILRASKLE